MAVEYLSHGLPLDEYVLTKADERRQRESEACWEWAREQAAKAPRWSQEKWEEMNALLSAGSDVPREVMRWRVRLYCGHLAEVTRNVGAQRPTGYDERCPECGFDRATIVAYEPVGREVQPPRSTRTRRLSQERGRRAVIAVDDPVRPAATQTARQTAAARHGRDEAPFGRDGAIGVERPAALSGTRRRRGQAAQDGVLPAAWRVLAMLDDLPEAVQASVAEMLVAHGTPPQRAAFCAREDVADSVRTGMLRAVGASEATRLLRCVSRLNAGLLLTVFQAHGASEDLLLACAAHLESDDLAVRIAGELRAAGAIEAARRWPRSRPLPLQVHSALIDAMLNDVPPRTGCNGPDKEENDRNLKAQMAAEGEWEDQLWELIEYVPQWWGDLAARDGRAGRHVQWVLLSRVDPMPDPVLRACLPAITHEWLSTRPGTPDLHAEIRLCALRDYVRQHPRLREIAQDRIDRTITEALAAGWEIRPRFCWASDWEPVDAAAELSHDAKVLERIARAVVAGDFPTSGVGLESKSEWDRCRSHVANRLAHNLYTPNGALREILPHLDEAGLGMAAQRHQQALRSRCAHELTTRRAASTAAERSGTRGPRRVPTDRQLAAQPDPVAALGERLPLPDDGSVERELAIAALLASRFSDAAVLDALPAERVLACEVQAAQVAARLVETLGTDPAAWRRLARWSRTVGEGRVDADIEFGQLLRTIRDDAL
ncbi:hypothetical protein ACWGCW_33785 [Streptomyces sp. NPDC054933]